VSSAVEQAIIKYATSASFSSSASGDATALVVPDSKRFKLISAIISPSGGVNTVILKTGAVTGIPAIDFAADIPFVLSYNPAGWIFGAVGADFIINLSAATATGINFTYMLWDS